MASSTTANARIAVLSSLLVLTTLAASLIPPAAAVPVPQSADLQVWNEDFEGAFPGANWAVNDSNPINGTDYWGQSAQRKFAGNGAVWSASVGAQTLFWNATTGNYTNDPSTITFENATQNALWNYSDDDALEGDDYWGANSLRFHGGTTAMWCAQVGFNNQANDTNANARIYDNEMSAYMWRTVNFSRVAAINATTVDLSFWYFTATENGVDFLEVVYDTGSGWQVAVSYTGDSAGWQTATTTLPVATTRFGFHFLSDSGGVLEGVYVDDVSLSASHSEPNQGLHIYDTQMNATMWRAVDLSPYATAFMEYRYWLDSFSPNDTLWAMYFSGGNWTYFDNHTGNSSGWQLSTVVIPVNATRVGFRFLSGVVGHKEGAYIDNVRVVGHVNSIQCTATSSPSSGYESSTVFNFSVSASQGLLPYTWSWNFNGSSNSTQSALRVFNALGSFNGTVTVTDAAGQSCTTTAPSVTVNQDTTAVRVFASAGTQVIEGKNITVNGLDRNGHPLSLTWSVSPPGCGNLSRLSGLNTTVDTGITSGGTVCQVKGAFGAANATINISVVHDLSRIIVDPPEAIAFEGSDLDLSATDANGHTLGFVWSTSCGTLSAYLNSPTTTFHAGDNGGLVCRVVASLNGSFTIVNITVLQDTSEIHINPDFALLIEGQTLGLGALNRFDHIIDVNWSVVPASCGSMSVDHGNYSIFSSSVDSGGLSCQVLGEVGGVSGAAVVNITHDTSVLALAADASALLEGERMELTFRDVNDHFYAAAWRVDPAACGVLSPMSGGAVNFTAGNDAAGLACVITASVNAQAWRTNVSIAHGPPASVEVAPPAAVVVEGTAITLGASVQDAFGHILSNRTPEWSSSCAQLSATEGISITATPPATAGGQTCLVVATFGTFTATITLTISYAPPYTVTISPATASLSAGQTQEFVATVTDANGVTPRNVSVRWASTCGGLSSQGGDRVTVTAPSDLGGAQCTVTASITVAGVTSSTGAPLSTGMSLLIPIMIVIPAAIGGFLFLRWWKKRPPKFEQIGEGLMDEKKFEVEIR